MMASSNLVKPMIDLVNANWFFDNVNDAIFIHDLGGNVLAVNHIACQRLGYSHNELLQMRVSDLDSPANRAQYAERIELLQQAGALILESAHRRQDGSYIPVEVNARLITLNGMPVIVSVVRDITERKRAEEALHRQAEQLATAHAQVARAEEKYRNIFENAVEGIFQSTPDGRYLNVNSAMARIYGYPSPAEMIAYVGNNIAHKIYADPAQRAEFIRRLEADGAIHEFEAPNLRRDGTVIWTSTSARAVRDANGKLLYYEGFVEDITERRNALEALRNSEARYRMLTEQAADGILNVDADARILDTNSTLCTMLGYTRDEMLGKRVSDILAPGSLEAAPIPFDELRAGKTAVIERMAQRKDGTFVPIEVRTKMLPDGTFQGILRDISERKQLEAANQAMLESQRQWNAELETQVQLKTAELRRLSETRDQLLRQLIVAQEEEHRRIARELHDETSQSLTALLANLAVVQALPPSKVKAHLNDIKAAVVEILKGVNQIVLDLRPTLLDDYGLMPALSWYANKRLGPNVRVEVTSPEPEVRLPATIETTLFRIGQEALTNVAKHAQAKHVWIDLQCDITKKILTLQVSDDGKGFVAQPIKPFNLDDRPHLGLLGMQERAQLIGGQITIVSTPGKGTTIQAHVPMEMMNKELVK